MIGAVETGLKLPAVKFFRWAGFGINRHSRESGNPETTQIPPSQPTGESQSLGYGD
jgi:hypothetical protein